MMMKLIPQPPNPPRYARTLAFGRTGTGKTRFLLTWPGLTAFDADGSMQHFRNAHPEVTVYATKSVVEIIATLRALRDENQLPETVGIDSINAVWNASCDAHPNDRFKDEATREMRALLEFLSSLKCHVVMTAWEKDEYYRTNDLIPTADGPYVVRPDERINRGARPDLPKDIEHAWDVVLWFQGTDCNTNRFAQVFAQRGDHLQQGAIIEDPTAKIILDTLSPETPIEAPSNEMLVALGRQLAELNPNLDTRTLVKYMRKKGMKVRDKQPLTDEIRFKIAEFMHIDIAACMKAGEIAAAPPAPVTAPAAAPPPPKSTAEQPKPEPEKVPPAIETAETPAPAQPTPQPEKTGDGKTAVDKNKIGLPIHLA